MTTTNRPSRKRSQPRSGVATTPPERAKARAGTGVINREQRQAMICEAAYFMAERRGLRAGHELEDWFAAEQQIDLVLTGGGPATAGTA
jgi:hypothetical protein